MTCLLCHLHYWTLQPLSPATGHQIGVHSYQSKATTSTKIDVEACRRLWAEGRHILWSLTNHKPEKLRDSLGECEDLLSSQRILSLQWKTLRHFLILLSSGTLLVFTVARHSGDIENVLIDRSLITKLRGQIDRALLLNRCLVLLYANENKVCLIGNSKRTGATFDETPTALTLTHEKLKKKIQRLSVLDLKSSELEVKGMPDHPQIVRNLLSNPQNDLLVVWWRDEQENGLRWSSMADGECTNVVLIKVKSNGKLELLTKIQTSCNPISIYFSKVQSNVISTFGQTTDDPTTYQISSIDCVNKSNIKQSTEAVLTIEGSVNVCSPNKDENMLAIGCDSGAIILYDIKKDQIRQSLAFFLHICSISWHPAGTIFFVCGSGGEIQCLDTALNPLQFLLASECEESSLPLLELRSFCMMPVQLEHVGWASASREGEGHGGCYDNFAMVFNQGPIVLLRLELGIYSKGKLSVFELVGEYLRHNQLYQCLQLFLSLNWDITPNDCFYCLTALMDRLLKLPIDPTNEELMESALSSFFAGNINSSIYEEFHDSVLLLSRRFFFKLLRNERFEKAFRLAVDLSSVDLFRELEYTATQKGLTPLVELSQKKLDELRKEELVKQAANGYINNDGEVISNPSCVSSLDKSITILQSSSESINNEMILKSPVHSSDGSGSLSCPTTPSKVTKTVSDTTTTCEQVNVINFKYFS